MSVPRGPEPFAEVSLLLSLLSVPHSTNPPPANMFASLSLSLSCSYPSPHPQLPPAPVLPPIPTPAPPKHPTPGPTPNHPPPFSRLPKSYNHSGRKSKYRLVFTLLLATKHSSNGDKVCPSFHSIFSERLSFLSGAKMNKVLVRRSLLSSGLRLTGRHLGRGFARKNTVARRQVLRGLYTYIYYWYFFPLRQCIVIHVPSPLESIIFQGRSSSSPSSITRNEHVHLFIFLQSSCLRLPPLANPCQPDSSSTSHPQVTSKSVLM